MVCACMAFFSLLLISLMVLKDIVSKDDTQVNFFSHSNIHPHKAESNNKKVIRRCLLPHLHC